MHMQEANRVTIECICQGHQCSGLHSKSQNKDLDFLHQAGLQTVKVVSDTVKQKKPSQRTTAVTMVSAQYGTHQEIFCQGHTSMLTVNNNTQARLHLSNRDQVRADRISLGQNQTLVFKELSIVCDCQMWRCLVLQAAKE